MSRQRSRNVPPVARHNVGNHNQTTNHRADCGRTNGIVLPLRLPLSTFTETSTANHRTPQTVNPGTASLVNRQILPFIFDLHYRYLIKTTEHSLLHEAPANKYAHNIRIENHSSRIWEVLPSFYYREVAEKQRNNKQTILYVVTDAAHLIFIFLRLGFTLTKCP